MRTILETATVAIYEIDGEFYVYLGAGDPIVCPSEGMAREVAAGGAA